MTQAEIVRLLQLEFSMIQDGAPVTGDTIHYTHTPDSMTKHFESVALYLEITMKQRFYEGERQGLEYGKKLVKETMETL